VQLKLTCLSRPPRLWPGEDELASTGAFNKPGDFQATIHKGIVERTSDRAPRRYTVAARGGPHEPAAVMVDHDGQVSLAFAVADLVDPDPPQPVEQIDLSCRFVARRSESPTTGRAPRQGRSPVGASAAVSETTRHHRGRRTRRRTPRGPDSCRGRGWFRVA
jgi:hypothetical protein